MRLHRPTIFRRPFTLLALPGALAAALFVALLAASLATPTAAGAASKVKPGSAPADAEPALDLGATKDKLVVLADGKQHFVAVVPFGEGAMEHLYYGDGKRFWKQRVSSGGSSGTESFERSFWEPRVSSPYQASIDFRNNKYVVQCDERKTELTPLPDAERATLLAAASFHAPRWKHRAYALARDNAGKYYYVDRVREPPESRVFRLYAGTKGNLKLQKMVNVVSDSEGDIFATRTGSLRLILDKHETTWVAGKKKTTLVSLPVEDNHVLIYTDLGAYTGERLGTPCDDL